MTTAVSFAFLLSLIGLAAAQCGTRGNHPSCASWNANVQFCTSSSFPLATKQAYCPTYCANLGFAVTTTAKPTATGVDANTNCAKWAANSANPFCASTTISTAMKTSFCAKTCTFEIAPNADCALYTVTGTTFARGTPSNRTATPGTAVASGAVASTTTLSRAYAGCTVKTFATANAGGDTSTGQLDTFVGTATTHFFTVTAANNGALSYTCVCS